jgi:hypothetical protein
MFSDGSTRREGDMAERGFKVVLRFANDVPSMAECTNREYKFLTPSILKRDSAGAELYLRLKLSRMSVRMSRPTHISWSSRMMGSGGWSVMDYSR